MRWQTIPPDTRQRRVEDYIRRQRIVRRRLVAGLVFAVVGVGLLFYWRLNA